MAEASSNALFELTSNITISSKADKLLKVIRKLSGGSSLGITRTQIGSYVGGTYKKELNELLRLNVPISKQAARRMHRSILLKMALVITRQSYVLLYQQPDDSSMQEEFVKKARLLMVKLCDQLEEEAYQLFDALESQLLKSS